MEYLAMKRAYLFLLSIGTCLVLLVLLLKGIGTSRSSGPLLIETPKPMVQPATKRVWKNNEVKKKLFTIGTENGKITLFNPMIVKPDRMGNIYVLDFGDKRLKKFTRDGKLEREFGKGSGRGPGEFSIVTDYEIAEDGCVWVCDPLNGRITVFDANGNVQNTIRPKEMPFRIVLLSDTRFVIMPSVHQIGYDLFSLYDKRGNRLKKFGMLFENQPQVQVALDANFAAAQGVTFVVAFVRIGVFAVYREDFENPLVYAGTIDYTGFPEIVRKTIGNRIISRVTRKGASAGLSVSVEGDEIHLLTESEEQPDKTAIDVYNMSTGLYKYSYALLSKASYASVTATRIYTVQDTTVTVWSR
jgi:hypothetical protein